MPTSLDTQQYQPPDHDAARLAHDATLSLGPRPEVVAILQAQYMDAAHEKSTAPAYEAAQGRPRRSSLSMVRIRSSRLTAINRAGYHLA